ncbi:MAG TPA: hypothetical protein VJ963_15260 [Bacteroidales bacterium]|nr:hypothetical protein [Bacteroidales bacterium]
MNNKHLRICLVGLFFALISSIICAQEIPQNRGPRIVSPLVADDNSVTFNIFSKNAQTVSLTGSWMGMGKTMKMTKNDEGVWSVKVGPLEPSIYLSDFAPRLFK